MSSTRERQAQDEALARILQLEEHGPQSRRNPSEPEPQLPQQLLRLSSQELRDLELARQFERFGVFSGPGSQRTDRIAAPPIQQRDRQFTVFGRSVQASGRRPTPEEDRRTGHLDPPLLSDSCSPVPNADHHVGGAALDHSLGDVTAEDRCRPSLSVDEPLAYARMLQERAFSSLQQQQHQEPTRQRRRKTESPSDLELARQMQELENNGLGRLNSERKFHHFSHDNDDDDDSDSESGIQLPAALSAKILRTSSQESDDAKLARFMEESGSSIRGLDEDQLNELLECSSNPSSGTAAARSTPRGRSPLPPSAFSHQEISLGPINCERLPPSGITNPDLVVPATIPQTRMRSAIHSAPTTPVNTHSERHHQASLVAQMPTMNPLSEEFVVDVPLKDKKKKKGFLGFGCRSDKKQSYPTSPSISNNSSAHSIIRGSGIPSAIPPPPGGSISAPPPMSPMLGSRRPAGLPSSPQPSSVTGDTSPHSPVFSPVFHRAVHSARAAGPRPTVGKVWAPSSPRKAPPRANNGARSLSPPVPSIPRPGPLPHSVSESRSITLDSLTHTGASTNRNRGPTICAACRQSGGSFVAALDKKYHVECFRCLYCNEKIDSAAPFSFSRDDQGEKHPYHPKCYAELYGVTCAVCNQTIPANFDGTVTFVKHPFFDSEQMCPHHAEIPGRRCTGCHRFEPLRNPFADLNDGDRCVCYSCCRTVVVDNTDVSPLWDRVLSFFEKKLNLPIWKEMRDIPILVVQSDALNDHMQPDNAHKGSSQIMARGLCLTDHGCGRNHRFKLPSLRYIQSSGSFEAVEDKGFTYYEFPESGPGNSQSSVFAILCLSGLPRDLTTSVLAHEATHAWIKMHPQYDSRRPLPAQVEEGCAQLVAMLLLTDGLESPDTTADSTEGPSDEKLRQYFKFSIEREIDETYGEGYRKAARAYSAIGIEALLSHAVRYREFPST